MVFESRTVKFWISVSLISLSLYNFYWLIDSFVGNYNIGFGMIVNAFRLLLGIQTNLSTIWIVAHAFGVIGTIVRFFGLTLALFLIYLLWGHTKAFFSAKGKISAAVFLEAAYFLCLLPSVAMLLWLGQDIFAASYLLQILMIAPLMIILSVKLWRNSASYSNVYIVKFAGLAYVGYVAAIFTNNTLRWVDNAMLPGFQLLPDMDATVKFVNAIVLLSLALAFAAAGVISFSDQRNRNLTAKLFGLSLIMVGTHFLMYVVYALIEGAYGSIMLVEVWAAPLLGLGIALFRARIDYENSLKQGNPG